MTTQEEWEARKWRVARFGGTYSNSVNNCNFLIHACWDALVFKFLMHAEVMIYRKGEYASQEAMAKLKARRESRNK